VPSLRDTASVFSEIFFIEYFTILVALLMTSSFSCLISLKRKQDIPKKENVILLYFEKPFKYAAIVVHVVHAYT